MKWSDLFEDRGTHAFSHTKLWANVGSAVLTVVFARDAWLGGLTDMKILAYGAIVCGSAAASKWLSFRYRDGNGTSPPQIPPTV